MPLSAVEICVEGALVPFMCRCCRSVLVTYVCVSQTVISSVWLLFHETTPLPYFIACDVGLAEGKSRRGGVQQVESTKKGKQWLRCKSRGTEESCRIGCRCLEVALQVLGG